MERLLVLMQYRNHKLHPFKTAWASLAPNGMLSVFFYHSKRKSVFIWGKIKRWDSESANRRATLSLAKNEGAYTGWKDEFYSTQRVNNCSLKK